MAQGAKTLLEVRNWNVAGHKRNNWRNLFQETKERNVVAWNNSFTKISHSEINNNFELKINIFDN